MSNYKLHTATVGVKWLIDLIAYLQSNVHVVRRVDSIAEVNVGAGPEPACNHRDRPVS